MIFLIRVKAHWIRATKIKKIILKKARKIILKVDKKMIKTQIKMDLCLNTNRILVKKATILFN